VTDLTQSHPFDDPAQPFDERNALEELERLADKIQLSRRQREQKVAEFDAFVRTFRMDRYASSIAATEGEQRRLEERPAVVAAATHATRAVAPVSETSGTVLPPVAVSPMVSATTFAHEPITQAMEVRSGLPRAAHVGVGLAALAVVAVSILLWRSAAGPVAPVAPANAPAVASPAPIAAASPAVAGPAPATTPERAMNLVFVTVRPVWARITVDGRRAMEREFPAGQRVIIGADRTIAIRAGDAGAIRLQVDGKDLGVLGRDGQIFSATYTAAQPR
jgi:hypothetical protein